MLLSSLTTNDFRLKRISTASLSLIEAHGHSLTQSTARSARVADTIERQFSVADIVIGGVEVRHTATDRAAVLWDIIREALNIIAPRAASILQESTDAHRATRQTQICRAFNTSYLLSVVVPAVGINSIDEADKLVGSVGVGGDVTVGTALAIDAQGRCSRRHKENSGNKVHVDGGVILVDADLSLSESQN